jgi:hypothetical protein
MSIAFVRLVAAAAVLAGAVAVIGAQEQDVERRIWSLLDNDQAQFVSLAEADFRAQAGFTLPDGGKAVTALAQKAPGGAFDPRDVAKIPKETLGYKADWIVERVRRYNLDWDITGLRLTSLDPEASKYPWLVIMNGGAANMYEFYVDLKNRPGWATSSTAGGTSRWTARSGSPRTSSIGSSR